MAEMGLAFGRASKAHLTFFGALCHCLRLCYGDYAASAAATVYDLLAGNWAKAFRVRAAFARRGETEPEVGGMMVTTRRKPYSILITDDDRGCREALRAIMEGEGYSTRVAASGEEALDIVRCEPIHLVLLDMQMPTLNGLETLELVRQVNAMLPCVIISADTTQSLMQQAMRARAYSVLAKPVSKPVVLYTVVQALLRAYGPPRNTP
jgi:CheY-like chemotaxis protein